MSFIGISIAAVITFLSARFPIKWIYGWMEPDPPRYAPTINTRFRIVEKD
jgi:hypothetical protein